MSSLMKPSMRLLPRSPFPCTPLLGLLAVAALLLGSSPARAACGVSSTTARSLVRLPMLSGAGAGQYSLIPSEPTIVGLWHVVYTAGGEVFNETLDQWHSDGTEFENAWLPPDVGNICFGVWKNTGARTVRLHHIGWTFTPGSNPPTATGTFTLDEVNTLSYDNKSYTGTFTFKTFNIDGSPTGVVVMGTIAATRITVQ